MIPRPQSFGAKLLLLFVFVVAAAQLATWAFVSTAHRVQAYTLIDEELRRAGGAFSRVVAERNALLAAGAATAARDYAFKRLFAGEADTVTIASALQSIRLSVDAHVVSVVALDGTPVASTSSATPAGNIVAHLVARADADPGPNPSATGYGYLAGELHSLVVAPVRAPDIVAWIVIGFRIDRDFAQRLKQQTGVDLTFLDQDARLLATTLPDATARALAAALPRLPQGQETTTLDLAGETALVATRTLAAGDGRSGLLALQYSLDEKLRPFRSTERTVLFVSLTSLLVAVLLSRRFARRLSQPIVELVGHTRRIAAGDYSIRNTVYRRDELGRLSEAFDQMARGLDERDRVRDLLDKNVSPEVAAQLLRDGAALGGEEREVTILFADLRGFTTLSEQLAPRDLLTLLNRYLDRMSAAIEREGGVIDKFIGDAIMALFGAPVTQPDSAGRALAAALGMERALAALNAELAAEGRPPLAIGVGINTARVVAGNIGSHRRLNYSVIGDGVNVASRLQSLTRTPEYRTNIIASAATLASRAEALAKAGRPPPADTFTTRPLGTVPVKGRAEPVKIFAVEA